jgi:germination protein M
VTLRFVVTLALAVVLLAGCGDDESQQTTTETTTTTGELSRTRVYFLLEENVWPVAREISEEGDAATEIVEQLAAGPTEDEQAIGLVSTFPAQAVTVSAVANGVATIEVVEELTIEQRAQLVYSLTALESLVQSVELDGESYTRADFEEQTPHVLVESPLAFEEVGSPVTASGTANTFEATFHYELTDTDGRIVDENFVTATSGTGTRGTFEFTTADYEIPFDGVGALIVFERSAEDGSRMNLVEIPLRMSR